MVCKTTHGLLRTLNKGGTSLPGKAALKLCPQILKEAARGVNIIAVTGTNGKTTVCRMIEAALRREGLSVLANRSGANLRHGIAAQLILNLDSSFAPRSPWAVIECDEAASVRVFSELQPKVVVVTNLFRDQLDRYGEVTHTRELILRALRGCPDTVLCLNADCSLTASLSRELPNKTRFYGLGRAAAGNGKRSGLSDAPRCLFCGTAYGYSYSSYAHLGAFYCPSCGWSRPKADVEVTRIENSTALLRVDGKSYDAQPALPGIYNLYNAAAAVAAVTAVGFGAESAVRALSDFECGFGRMERFALGKCGTQMLLVKNPAACDQALEYLAGCPEEFTLVLGLNDRAADGRDVSWIWDANFEALLHLPQLKRIYVTGDRAYDMALRLKYAGVSERDVRIIKSGAELIDELSACENRVYILPTYTAMLSLRSLIIGKVGGREFWE